MKTIKKEMKEVEQVALICDFCGSEPQRMKICFICKKDICYNCAIKTDIEGLQEGYFYSDYPNYYCGECWQIGKDIRKKINQIRDKADEEESELWEEWRKLK